MGLTIAFDVYGTLVNPLAIANPLRSRVGDLAGRFAELWRMKQLEYSLRRADAFVSALFGVHAAGFAIHGTGLGGDAERTIPQAAVLIKSSIFRVRWQPPTVAVATA